MAKIKLYGYATSPYVRKTGCFLYYKGIDFTHVPVNPLKPKVTIGHTNGTQVPPTWAGWISQQCLILLSFHNSYLATSNAPSS